MEIVSEESIKRDYRYKRSEYAAVEIPEYWIVDSFQNKVSVLVLVEGFYEDSQFTGEARIVSGVFEELAVTADRMLGTGATWVSLFLTEQRKMEIQVPALARVKGVLPAL